MSSSIAAADLYANVGVVFSLDGSNSEPIYANIGLEQPDAANTSADLQANVSLSAPTSTIYGTIPDNARIGDSILIVAVGVGSSSSVFNPRISGQLNDGTWAYIPITSYTTYPATADAFTASRQISEDLSIVDCEHQRLGMIVPSWADPPNLPLRIVQFDGNSSTADFHSAAETIFANIT